MSQDKKEDGYNVVFRSTGIESPGYKGVITWSTFRDKKQFDAWFNEELRRRYDVIAEGVSPEEAIEHSRRTSLSAQLTAALQEATDRRGEINLDILRFQLTNVALVRLLDAEAQGQ